MDVKTCWWIYWKKTQNELYMCSNNSETVIEVITLYKNE